MDSKFKTVPITELAEIITGASISDIAFKHSGDYEYLQGNYIPTFGDRDKRFVNIESIPQKYKKCILRPGDIILPRLYKKLHLMVYRENNQPAIASSSLIILRSSNEDYLLSFLKTKEGLTQFKNQAELNNTKLNETFRFSADSISRIQVPILPIPKLNLLGNDGIALSSYDELKNIMQMLESLKKDFSRFKIENMNLFQSFVINRLGRIDFTLKRMDTKLDTAIGYLSEIKTDFFEVRNAARTAEEKIFRLYKKIDEKLDRLQSQDAIVLDGYIDEIKNWLLYWELLEPESQKFLPLAEYLFDEINKMEDADFSPFILQYCRSIENEMLKKLFVAYHIDGLVGINIDELIKSDLKHQKTGKFAQMIKRNKMTYTLGEMNYILSLLKDGGSTISESALLQHFRIFILKYFDDTILQSEFLQNLEKLTSEFRNKAAHPYSQNQNTAIQCQELLRNCLNSFLESSKNNW